MSEANLETNTRHAALFLRATINWETFTLKDPEETQFTDAFATLLTKKSVDTRGRTLVGLWNTVGNLPSRFDLSTIATYNYKAGALDAHMSI